MFERLFKRKEEAVPEPMPEVKPSEVIGSNREKRTFRMSPNLLYDIITRQAGSMEKAVLEMAQNAIDADASLITIWVEPGRIVFHDDGVGMTKEEVLWYFEVFGDSFKRGNDKYLGTFGMGRGQVFAQGRTVWLTHKNIMTVDIKEKGLDYELVEGLEDKKGTTISIDLYRPVVPFFILEKLKEWLKYVPVTVKLNGEDIERGTFEGKVYQTPEATIAIEVSNRGLKIYNRGIYVKTDMSYGARAVVVSKKNLKVNFARNDVMDDCPVWQAISKDVDKHLINALADPSIVQTVDTKRQIVRLITESDVAREQLGHIPAFKTGNDQWVSYDDVVDKGEVSFCRLADGRLADVVIQGGGLVLQDKPEYKNLFRQASVVFQDFAEQTKSVIISVKEFRAKSAAEKARVELAERMMSSMGFRRQLRFGDHPSAVAWTDGRSIVWLHQRLIRIPERQFVLQAYELMVHEMAHDNDTERSDIHGDEWYQKYHELVQRTISDLDEFVGGAA